jgi:hypothetical protein
LARGYVRDEEGKKWEADAIEGNLEGESFAQERFFFLSISLIHIPGGFGIISLFPTNNLSGPFWVSSPKFEVSSCCEGVATRAWVEGVAWEGVELGVELLFFFFLY